MGRTLAVALVATLALVFACERGDAPDAQPAPAPAAPAPAPAAAPAPGTGSGEPSEAAEEEAEQIFETRCVTCHGPRGEGNGPASAGLTPPPRNFTDPTWQTSVTDDHIEKIIKFGGAAVGKSPAMPANPDLMAKAEVVAALRAHIRELGGNDD
jgi:mono/diheme cytochrome c family protein